MAALTSIPTKLYNDKELKDFDIRLYLIIAECVGDYGYSKISNDTLCFKTNKSERAIRDSLKRLIAQGYLKTKFNVKQNNIYDQDAKRVIWLEEFYRKYHYRTRKAKEKTKANDFRCFVQWLKTDLKGLYIPVELGGLTHKYVIKTVGKKDLMHIVRDGTEHPLDSFDSNDVYKRMFRKKGVLLSWAEQEENSQAMQKMQDLANNKRV